MTPEELKIKVQKKREKELKVSECMIKVYCKGQKHPHQGTDKSKNILCEDCQALLDYAKMRTEKCPFMETKTYCSNCKVHCYKPEMRKKMKAVMRYSGPRMMFHHPIMAIDHVIQTVKHRQQKEDKKSDK